jgi:cell division septum initiation protein DivIVA
MNLETALYFLDTNTRVQCPEITAQQARELAELLRDAEGAAGMARRALAQLQKERDEARAAHEATTAAMIEDVARANAAIAEARQLRAEVEKLKQPVVHCSACNSLMHSTRNHPTSDVEVDASDYEKPRKVKP